MKPTRALLFLLLLSGPVAADRPDTRHGVVEDGDTTLSLEGGLTFTVQHAQSPGIRDEAALSVDLVAVIPQGIGHWTLYLEGATSPVRNGVAEQLPEANADVGTALDSRGQGRVQLSVLHYTLPLPGGSLTMGLLDSAGYLDRSEVANDETRQFMAAELVNNPTLALPDYHPALVLHHHAGPETPGFTLLLGSSHGLAENGGRYGDLLRVDQKGKGVFAAVEGYGYLDRVLWRLGVWHNGAAQPLLSKPEKRGRRLGIYLNLDGTSGDMRWNLRVGQADPRASAAWRFASLALERDLGNVRIGLGAAWTGASPHLTEGGDRVHLECLVRFKVHPGLEITPDLQWLRHSGLEERRPDQWIGGLRVTYLF